MRISEIIASLVPKVRAIGPTKGADELNRSGGIHSTPDQITLSSESQLLSRLRNRRENSRRRTGTIIPTIFKN
ncbi:MAG: hypothetical protein NTY09_05475 [bacterium]|nr:hypothetical protein [bacterium]